MAVKTTAWTVTEGDGKDGGVQLRESTTGIVELTWFCGDVRRFGVEDLEQSVDLVNAMEPYPDVWLKLRDSDGNKLAVRLQEGRIFADVEDSQELPPRSVEWSELKECFGIVLGKDIDAEQDAVEDKAAKAAKKAKSKAKPATKAVAGAAKKAASAAKKSTASRPSRTSGSRRAR
jgi:hypothetical protein